MRHWMTRTKMYSPGNGADGRQRQSTLQFGHPKWDFRGLRPPVYRQIHVLVVSEPPMLHRWRSRAGLRNFGLERRVWSQCQLNKSISSILSQGSKLRRARTIRNSSSILSIR